jgi:5-formyltetrahydrofolate cyclo-ligase
MNNDKMLLRVWLKSRRLAMDKTEVERLGKIIQQKLIDSLNWQNIRSVHCYEAIESLNEVNTEEVINFIKASQPHIKLTLQDKTHKLPLPDQGFDLVIVPILGFDQRNYRLGWGGGYYDQLLALQPKALKIGLCFNNGLIKKGLPNEPHDIALDKIFTEV